MNLIMRLGILIVVVIDLQIILINESSKMSIKLKLIVYKIINIDSFNHFSNFTKIKSIILIIFNSSKSII